MVSAWRAGRRGAVMNKADSEFRKDVRAMVKDFRRLGDKDAVKAMKAASRAAAQVAVPYVQAEAPVRTTHPARHPPSGTLKRKVSAKSSATIPKIQVGTPKFGGPYVWFVLQGRRLPSGRILKPNRFIYRGIVDAWRPVMREYEKGMRRVAKQFNRKIGGR